jgi:hypothetical protein
MMMTFEDGTHGFVLAVLLLATTMQAHSKVDPQLDSNLRSAIADVRSQEPLKARLAAAERLASLTSKSRSRNVSDATLGDLIALLDDPEDGVRFFAAAALGNLKAKEAAPKLLALLPAADCLEGPVTSARSIRFALERLGVKPPPRPTYNDCHRPK